MTDRGRGRPGEEGPPQGRAGSSGSGEGGPRGQTRLSYPVPPAAAAAWAVSQELTPQNPGLILDRFVPDWGREPHGEREPWKKRGLDAVRRAAERVDGPLVTAWNRRWEAAARSVQAEPFTRRTDWRLIAGLGRKGPLEVGFTFNRYGLPMLPGSSLKGLARMAALLAVAEAIGEDGLAAVHAQHPARIDRVREPGREPGELEALAALLEQETEKAFEGGWAPPLAAFPPAARALAGDFRVIFGTTGGSGRAIFLDAIPERKPALELDIMNPHVPDYYRPGSTTPPTDWQSPTPVYFLTVAKDTAFCFAVGWRGPLDADAVHRRQHARDWLTAGLTELGAGGKTGAGYGYFLPTPAPPQPVVTTPAAAAGQSSIATPAAPAQPAAPSAPDEPLDWRVGTVRDFQPQRGGLVVDEETEDRLRFNVDAIAEKGWSPKNKATIQYAVQERDGKQVVVQVRKPQ